LNAYTALFDACVLYPQTIRDALLSLARTNLFRARWSAHINEEWTRARLHKHPEKAAQINYTLEQVNNSVEDCLVTGYEPLIDGIELPDPDDRHVLAAAVVGRADVIVTLDLSHFPDEALAPYNIEAQHPDEFIVHQFGVNEPLALSAFKAMRAPLKNPAMTADEFLNHLEAKGLVETMAALRPYAEFI
jgi:predicted nucleic acid-binding protein